MDHLTVPQSYDDYPVDVTSEYMAIDHNRCVLCGRCVRSCHEIAGAYVLSFQGRGIKNRIAFDLGLSRGDSACLCCGACLQLCPTGALFNRYRSHRSVKGHPQTERTTTEAFCHRCGLMCDTRIVVEENQLLKIDGCIAPGKSGPDRGQLCVKGRFEPLKSPGRRLVAPMIRGGGGKWTETSWKAAMDMIESRIGGGKEGTFGLVSSRCANEQLMIFRDLMVKGWGVDYLDTLDGRSLRTIHSAWEELGKIFLGLKEPSWHRLQDADHILVVGVPSFETQPLIGGSTRRAVLEKGIGVTVMGSNNPLESLGAAVVPMPAGTESLIVSAFLSQVLKSQAVERSSSWAQILSKQAEVDVEKCLRQAGLDASARAAFTAAAEAYGRSKSPMVIAGPAITDVPRAFALYELMLVSLVKGILPENALRLVILKANGNSAAALKLRVAAGVAEGRHRRGLMLLEDEDLSGSPIMERLMGLDFLAVITPYFPEALKAGAHVLIPRPANLEEEGSYTSLDGKKILTLPAMLKRPKEVTESWQTLLALMQRTETHPSYARWKDISASAIGEMQSGS
jgi:formate dehydrogenase major subunit